MKKILLSLALLIALAACDSAPEGYTIAGDVRGELENGTQVFLKKVGETGQPVDIDTTTVEAGKFTFTGAITLPEMHYIFIDQLQGYTAVVLENGEISFSAHKDSLGLAEIKGTMQNDLFSKFMKKSQAISNRARSVSEDMQTADEAVAASLRDEMKELQEEYETFEIDYVKENPNALISVLLIDKAMASRVLTSEEVENLYEGLTPEMKETTAAEKVQTQLAALKESAEKSKSTEIGAVAPKFTAPGPDGQEIALDDVLGKVTLIDFWAAWCKPCRAENPNVVAVYKKYHDKGLNVIGVSLDRKAEDWKKAIEDDGLTWNHVSHVQFFNDPIAKLYNVDAIPAAFLLDENGVIIAKNLRGRALGEKVGELLN